MKIKILKCCAGLKFSYTAGETANADDLVAKDLIQAGYAEQDIAPKDNGSPKEKQDTATENTGKTAQTTAAKEAKTDDKGNNAAGSGAGKP